MYEKKWKETEEEERRGEVVVCPSEEEPPSAGYVKKSRRHSTAPWRFLFSHSPAICLLPSSLHSSSPSHPPLRKSAAILDIVHDTWKPRSRLRVWQISRGRPVDTRRQRGKSLDATILSRKGNREGESSKEMYLGRPSFRPPPHRQLALLARDSRACERSLRETPSINTCIGWCLSSSLSWRALSSRPVETSAPNETSFPGAEARRLSLSLG